MKPHIAYLACFAKYRLFWIFEKVQPFLKPHILFYGNGLAISHGLPDITHIKVNWLMS